MNTQEAKKTKRVVKSVEYVREYQEAVDSPERREYNEARNKACYWIVAQRKAAKKLKEKGEWREGFDDII